MFKKLRNGEIWSQAEQEERRCCVCKVKSLQRDLEPNMKHLFTYSQTDLTRYQMFVYVCSLCSYVCRYYCRNRWPTALNELEMILAMIFKLVHWNQNSVVSTHLFQTSKNVYIFGKWWFYFKHYLQSHLKLTSKHP